MSISIQQINAVLPQTQCRECGYAGCLPYAQAMVNDDADVHLCAPGGQEVMLDLAQLLQRPPKMPAKTHQNVLAWIDEAVCIGCAACIRVCPVDAIFGASKLMHTVLADECTGCGLCVPACPVDCIELQPTDADYLPMARYLNDDVARQPRFAAAAHAQKRYEQRQARQQRDAAERQKQQAERAAQMRAKATVRQHASEAQKVQAALNPAALIAQAMARAQSQQSQRVTSNNRDEFREQQVKEAQERATYRRYQRDAQYGNEQEKAIAIAWLKQYKAEQEARELARLNLS